jgi:hypothetical protein
VTVAEALIYPMIRGIAHQLKSGQLKPKDLAKPLKRWWPIALPELLPFLQSPDLSMLTCLLRTRRGPYWHPLVMMQIDHLLRLSEDEAAWKECGWEMEVDDDGVASSPKEAVEVHKHLHDLVDAHVGALLRGHGVAPRRVPKRPGPKGLKNRYPAAPSLGDMLIDAQHLSRSFELLHKGLTLRKSELREKSGESQERAVQRIERVVREVLDVYGPGWSRLREERLLDSSWRFDPTKAPWDQAPLRTSTHWSIDVGRVVRDLLAKPGPRLKEKEGAPAYLASALIGLLLDVRPERVNRAVAHQRYRRQGVRRRPVGESAA